MFKFIRNFILLIVVLAVGAFFTVNYWVGSVIEYAGKQVLQTEVNVGNIFVSPLNGQGQITGLSIQNPAGYPQDTAFKLGSLLVNANPLSFFEDTLVVERIVLDAPELVVYRQGRSSNFQVLAANASQSSGRSKASAPAEAAATAKRGGKSVFIREMRIQNVTAKVYLHDAIKPVAINVDGITLNNLGGAGASTADVIKEISMALGRLVEQNVLSSEALSRLQGQARQQLDQTRQKVEEKITDTVNDAAKQAGDAVNEGLNNLLGR